MGVDKCFNGSCCYWDMEKSDNCAHPWRPMSECADAMIRKVNPLKSASFYVEELWSTECQCGRGKKPKYPFCYKCYTSLPEELKADLYSKMGDGYEEAYEAAVLFLTEE